MHELSLSELNLHIQKTLEDQLAASYWVVAEIGQLQLNQSGHCYLELIQKEDGKIVAKARATIWAYSYRNISAWFQKITGSDLEEGMRILANAKVTFHEVYGLSLNIKDIDPSYTLGEREKARKEVIQKLEQDGVMEMNKGLSLPIVPQNIAIISSQTAAGYGDFISQLKHNPFRYKIHHQLFPAIMQGDKAPLSIIEALHQVNKTNNIDLVVIIRGGGSQLDLDCFDDYDLCSHIAQFPLPILTGVGHERDTTISDMVAHTQLKTPTAVAEFIIQGITAFQIQIDDFFNTIQSISLAHIDTEKESLMYISRSIAQYASSHLNTNKVDIASISQSLKHLANNQLKTNRNTLSTIEQKINLLNPKHLLERGYTLTYHNGYPLGKKLVAKGDKIETITSSQRIKSTVETNMKIIN